MGSHSTQGLAIVGFLVAFTILGGAMFAGGNLLLMLLFLVVAAISVWLFQKAKASSEQG